MTIKLEDLIPGGKANGMSLEDIAKHHAYGDKKESLPKEEMLKMYSHLRKELKKGIKVEKEHTNSESDAREIAMDHLYENPDYYSKLNKAGLVDESRVGNMIIDIGETIEEIFNQTMKLENLIKYQPNTTAQEMNINKIKIAIANLKRMYKDVYDFGGK